MTSSTEPSTGQSTASNNPPVSLLGLRGPASAGKTTLAYQLSYVFTPHSSISSMAMISARHLAFYPPTTAISMLMDRVVWILSIWSKSLDHVKANGGKRPEEFMSWQSDVFPDQEMRALRMVGRNTMEWLSDKVSEQLGDLRHTIVIIEGFLLYHLPDVRRRLNGKLFVRLDHEEARRRRLTRPSYGVEAKEGEFWKTEDYFEKMVWRNYVEQHADFFEDGDVEGSIDRKLCSERGIVMHEGMNVEAEQTLS